MASYLRWLWLPEVDLTIGVPPKCGSSAIYLSLQQHYGVESLIDCRQVHFIRQRPTGNVVFVTREPLSRFMSLHANKCVRRGKVAAYPTDLHGLTPRQLLEFIKANNNSHWQRQVDLLDGADALLIPLPELDSYWETLPFPKLQRTNVSQSYAPISDTLRADILEHYAADVSLYERSAMQR